MTTSTSTTSSMFRLRSHRTRRIIKISVFPLLLLVAFLLDRVDSFVVAPFGTSGKTASGGGTTTRSVITNEHQQQLLTSSSSSRPLVTPTTTTTTTCLLSKRDNVDDDGGGGMWGATNKARTDIRNFLTQRALQSFLFLLLNCRDQATVRWFENAYSCNHLESFHGTGGLNMTLFPEWDGILLDMLARPQSVMVIRSRRRGPPRGGRSKNNPFLEEERFEEYEVDIDPPSLVARICSVREQLAGEWVKDLQTLRDANEMILDAYYQAQDDERKTAAATTSAVDQGESNEEAEDANETDDDDDDEKDKEVSTAESNHDPESYEEKLKANAEKKAYDRCAMMVLGNHIVSESTASSPLRRGTFDLLGLLATQESVHRVLRSYREAGDEREVSFLWLREFYFARLASHFDGSQRSGRADDFFEELLLKTPSMKQVGDTIGLIDPHRIAEDIIAMRSVVAREWVDTVRDVVRIDHETLRHSVMGVQMDRRLEETGQIVKEQSAVFEQGFQ